MGETKRRHDCKGSRIASYGSLLSRDQQDGRAISNTTRQLSEAGKRGREQALYGTARATEWMQGFSIEGAVVMNEILVLAVTVFVGIFAAGAVECNIWPR
jgi:hypothetical protein